MSQTTSKTHITYKNILTLLLRLTAVLLVTLAVTAVVLLGAIYVLCRSGSETARDDFVRTVKETSAAGFLADIFLSPSEVAEILSPPTHTHKRRLKPKQMRGW